MGKLSALRRHHRRRMLAKAYKVYFNKQWALMNYDHMTDCSCAMCGNKRHNKWLPLKEKLTMQERKSNEAYKYSLETLFNI